MNASDLSSKLAEANRRLAELEAVEAQHEQDAKLQDALYRIAELVSAAPDLQEFYRAVHGVVAEFMEATNFYIALYDDERRLINWPYYVDQVDADLPDPNRWDPFGSGEARGVTAYVLRAGEPQHLSGPRLQELAERGEFDVLGPLAEDGLWVPLKSGGGRAVGVLAVQSYTPNVGYTEQDEQLLAFVGQSLGVALSRARALEETRQRNAELALINSVQNALAGELELQAIYDAVGDRIRDVFDAQVVDIAIYDEHSGRLRFPYTIERGVRFPEEQIELVGFRKHVMEAREPLMILEGMLEQQQRYDSPSLVGEMPQSALFVPLLVGARATGVISLQNLDRTHAFSDDDQRLLTTLAASLSVALENARLVHETRQRNAELALITSVQDALAGELELQAIYDAVGDRIRDVFDAQVVDITIHDPATGLLHSPYLIERGVRLPDEPVAPFGFRKHVMETRAPLLIEETSVELMMRYGSQVDVGEMAKSTLFVPLLVGGRATGVISLQNIDRTHAFDEDDQRLLQTLAASLSVALENARLVHETRQRVAELATVNSVGQALSSQLDLDALIELVGEQLRETFAADLAYVALHDRAAGRIDFVYYYESGERRQEPAMVYGEGLTSQILESREPLLLNRSSQFERREMVGTTVRSYLGVPILVGDEAIGVVSVQSIEEDGRFGDADAHLLATIAANVGVAIHNARLFSEVERQRGYLESLLAISPVAVVVLDAEERVTDWNPAAAELFGYAAQEALGRPIDELVFGNSSHDEGRELTREAIQSGRAQRITVRRSRDGSLVHVELMLVPLSVDGSHVGFIGVYHDVTELQRARQEAEAATQAKSAFLATMSHEIRTPMNAVIGMTELLLGTELTGEQREFAEVVRTSGDALLHVIDDILDYSKIEAGKLDLEHTAFALRECLEGALDIVAPRAWEKGIELGCLIDEAAPAGIVGDQARLRQVLLNLLSNAVKFTEAGEVVVAVHAQPVGSGSHRLELLVRDTGIGIPADHIDRLFDSFSQVDASTTRRFGGTGLGLAISKRLVELMGGGISVRSELGSGSTFGIELPVTAAALPSSLAPDEGLPQLAGRRLLVVDDNATNREIVARLSRAWGMEPVAVELPSEALALLDAGERFDVAVLDMMMPGTDGLGLGAEISRRRGAQPLPLVLLTSLGRLPEHEWSGVFAAQLAKPLKASQLYNTLLNVLGTGADGEQAAVGQAAATPAPSSLRILLAEDNAMNRRVALALLERLGYRADVANNGLQALDALERQPYDVVLMDVQMPELDGLDATRQICARWPAERRPRIIAMTANALPEDREACFAAGMHDYVAKPIRYDELAAALGRARPLRDDGGGAEADAGISPAAGAVSLDAAALQSLREIGGSEFLAEVVSLFLADAPGLVTSLRSSLELRDAEELRRAAHTLKSNGSTLGAAAFAELCRQAEQQAKEGRLEGVSQLVDGIEREYRALDDALASLVSEPRS
ncbi:MAG: GAF domain-containing protein [Acidobacteriota bacterium]|nr:GAF domain-containing protein [Acidobacteriota bacterium]